jgi:hypothetical protein
MPANSAPHLLPTQESFLRDLNGLLSQPVSLTCLGGFVINACYGFPRPTGDVDYIGISPAEASVQIEMIAGEGSRLCKKYKVHFHRVPAIVTLPEDALTRATEMFEGRFKNLHLFALDPYDLALSKLERNSEKDREDVEYLAKTVPLDAVLLRDRYEKELRPYLVHQDRHDLTIRLWIESYFKS